MPVVQRKQTSPVRVIILLALGVLGYCLIKIGPGYYRAWRFQLAMDKAFQEYKGVEEDLLIETLIHKADSLGLPELSPDNFTCDCEPGAESTLEVEYTEAVSFPAGFVWSRNRRLAVHAVLPAAYEGAQPKDLLLQQRERTTE